MSLRSLGGGKKRCQVDSLVWEFIWKGRGQGWWQICEKLAQGNTCKSPEDMGLPEEE